MIHALKARYIFPAISKPISDGMVAINGESIVEVGEHVSADHVIDLGNAAILPGLINAHTHLELSNTTKPLGSPSIGFSEWIRRVIDYRRQSVPADSSVIQKTLQECVRYGVTTVADIAQSTATIPDTESPLIDYTAFLELIAPTNNRVDKAIELAEQFLDTEHAKITKNKLQNYDQGLSPHSPYSVNLELLKNAVSISCKNKIPLAMHLAESLDEIQWLADGTGPMKELLIELGAYDASDIPSGRCALDYLKVLAQSHRTLIIHGNYLDDEEMAFLAQHSDRMSVVYCPRTHSYFNHQPYPLEKMLNAGVNVCLGTDSRASSPDLDLLAEIRHVARLFPALDPQLIMQLGTIQGAKALGKSCSIGSIDVGKEANLTVVPLPSHNTTNPYQLLFDYHEPAAQTWFRGKKIFG